MFHRTVLSYISAVLLTVCVYHFAKAVFIYRRANRYLFFSIATLGGSFFVFCSLMLSFELAPETILFYHKLKILSVMVCIIGWFYCMYEIYFEESRAPKAFLIIAILIALTAPFDIFLSLPTQNNSIEFMGLVFDHYYAKPNVTYSILALVVLGFFGYSIIKVALIKNPQVNKAYGMLAFLPGLVCGFNDFAVTHGFMAQLFISEYLVFGFLISVSALFLIEEQHNFTTAQVLNLKLEEEVRNRTRELEEANGKLLTAAATDKLTGLGNQTELRKRLQLEEERLNRENYSDLAIVFVDLDNFKFYNDSFGHRAGDFLLKKIGNLINTNLRYVDFVARYGGDEFVIISPDTTAQESVISIERLYFKLKEEDHFIPELKDFLQEDIEIPPELKLSFSCGIAGYRKGVPLNELIVQADKALYESKNSGRNRYTIWSG